MLNPDAFRELARHYDALMSHVDYARWALTAQAIAELLPNRPVHLDAACGTGVLMRTLAPCGWQSVGVDLSTAMLRAGRREQTGPCATADLRALPFDASFDLVTCLFDSMNFLLTTEDLHRGIAECARVLRPGGLLYFDAVTERMVLQHFAGQQWEERMGRHSTAWESRYSPGTGLSETEVRISDGSAGVIRERMYPRAEFERALQAAGLDLLLCVDAETWKCPRRRTVRLDFVAAKQPPRAYARGLKHCRATVQALLA